MQTRTKILIGVSVLVIIILIIIIVVSIKKKKNTVPQNSGTSSGTHSGSNTSCVSFTQAQYDGKVAECREKCSAKLFIPFLGVGLYDTCVDECKVGIPEVKVC